MLEPTPQHTESLVDSFAALNVSKPILQALERIGYQKPTPVQAATIPLIYAGIDLIVQSQTGTGKTAAFAIPICDMLRDTEAAGGNAVVECLVLAPTRELAKQVCTEFARISPDVPSTAIYGGTSYGPQLEALKSARVIAATPGRLLDHLRSGNIKLDNLRLFVLDEADEMLSMGFQEELDAIIEFLPAARSQSLLFSATVSEDIKSLASHFLQHPEYVTLSSDSVAAKSVKHLYYVTSGLSQLRDLVTLIEAHDPESALIFCNTRDDTQLVASHLARTGYKADIINGDLPQSERERALYTLKEGQIRFLVATDVAARGIDISGLPFVINYQMPISAENYIHRTGRTGRAGRKGIAITLMTPREIGTYYQLIRVYHIDLEERPLPSREQLNEIREARVRDALVERLREDPSTRRHAPFVTLAERIRSAGDASELIARLVVYYETSRRREDARAAALERAREQGRRHNDETRELRSRLEQSEQHMLALRERVVELEGSGEELARLRDELESMRSELDRAEETTRTARGELAQAEEATRAARAELARSTDSVRALEARLEQAGRTEADAAQRAERAERRVSQLESELERARSRASTDAAPAPAPARSPAGEAAARAEQPPVPEPRSRRRPPREPERSAAVSLSEPQADVTASVSPVEVAEASEARLEAEAERYSSRGARRDRRRARRERPVPLAEDAEPSEFPATPPVAAPAVVARPVEDSVEPRASEERAARGRSPRRRDEEAEEPGRTSGRRRRSRRRGRSERDENGAESAAERPVVVAAPPPAPEPSDEAAAEEGGFATIAVSVERSEIIDHPDKLRELVCYMAGLFPEDLGEVSRSNGRFLVDVRADYAHDVVEALDGQAWKGRRMRARAAATRA